MTADPPTGTPGLAPPSTDVEPGIARLEFWFDVISPFAYLAFEELPRTLEGLSVVVDYRPLLFAGLLQHWGQKGPAEIEPKRAFTFRHVHWWAARHGVPMVTPHQHPFNPLPLLRLLLASGPNRRTVEAVMHHVWREGGDVLDPARLQALQERLAPPVPPQSEAVKAALRASTDEAVARGLFGVPSITWGERVFWGLDALPMLRDALQRHPWFDGPAWDAEGAPRPGVRRGP